MLFSQKNKVWIQFVRFSSRPCYHKKINYLSHVLHWGSCDAKSQVPREITFSFRGTARRPQPLAPSQAGRLLGRPAVSPSLWQSHSNPPVRPSPTPHRNELLIWALLRHSLNSSGLSLVPSAHNPCYQVCPQLIHYRASAESTRTLPMYRPQGKSSDTSTACLFWSGGQRPEPIQPDWLIAVVWSAGG